MGPLITPAQRDSVEGYIQIGVDEGAKLVCGGERVGTVGNFCRRLSLPELSRICGSSRKRSSGRWWR